MKPKLFPRLALALISAALASTAQANLLTNGSFEAPLGPANAGGNGFLRYNAPNQGIAGWTLTSGSIEAFTNFAGTGTVALDMTGLHTAAGGAGPGSLQQSFATTIGAVYNVSFLMGGGNEPFIKKMEVAVFGAMLVWSEEFSQDSTQLPTPTTLMLQQFSFVATDLSSTIRFSSLVNSSWDGPLLDAVSVTADVPEGETWALMLAGLGALGWMRRRASAG